ncbi:MAG: AI-2E family transporter [Nitriliruptorales bacterium]|nr:AI-2E family transporter [Nitriliruptorales bacterium]
MPDDPGSHHPHPDASPESAVTPLLRSTWLLIGVGIVLWAAWRIFHEPIGVILPPLGLAGVIVYLLNPLVSWLERHRLHRAIAAALAYLVVAGAAVGLGFAVGPVITDQVGDLIRESPNIAVSTQDFINERLLDAGIDYEVSFDFSDEQTQQSIREWVEANSDRLLALAGGAFDLVGRLFHVALTLILAPFLAFYILVDLPKISSTLTRLVPPGSRGEVIVVAGRIGSLVGAYFRGQLLVAAFVGAASSVALWAIGLPFWAIVGLTAGVFNLIPLIGPFVGGLIGVIIALTVGDGLQQAILVVVLLTAVQQIDNHVITPNIMSRTVKVHPVTVIITLAAAATMFGILGMLVAIPLVAAAKLVVIYLLVTRVPSMAHLGGDTVELFDEDGMPVDAPRSDDSALFAMGRDLRAAWEKVRRRDGSDVVGDVGTLDEVVDAGTLDDGGDETG